MAKRSNGYGTGPRIRKNKGDSGNAMPKVILAGGKEGGLNDLKKYDLLRFILPSSKSDILLFGGFDDYGNMVAIYSDKKTHPSGKFVIIGSWWVGAEKIEILAREAEGVFNYIIIEFEKQKEVEKAAKKALEIFDKISVSLGD